MPNLYRRNFAFDRKAEVFGTSQEEASIGRIPCFKGHLMGMEFISFLEETDRAYTTGKSTRRPGSLICNDKLGYALKNT